MKGVHGKILVVDLKQQPAVSNRRITGRGLSPLPGRVWTASPPVPQWRMCSRGFKEAFSSRKISSVRTTAHLRLTKSWGMSFVADPTPGRHTDSNYDMGQLGMSDFFPDLKPLIEIAKDPYQQGKSSVVPVKLHQVMESMGLCLFSYFFSDYRMLEMLAVVTGWEMTAEKNFEIGGRIQTIRQMFNACEGAIRHEITPRAVGNPPQQKGPLAGKTIDVATMARGYYDGMGFQSDGITTAEI